MIVIEDLVDLEILAQLRKLKPYAKAHPLTLEKLKNRKALLKASQYPEHFVLFKFGLALSLFYELQEKPLWHVSFEAVNEIPPTCETCDALLECLGLPPLEDRLAEHIQGTVLNVWFLDKENENEQSLSA